MNNAKGRNAPFSSEQEVQKAIIDYLQYHRVFCWKQNNTGVYKHSTGRYIPSGKKGLPDIVAVVGGKFVGIECKRKGGVQTESQKLFQTQLERAGGLYILARSIEDVECLVKTTEEK